MSKLLNFIKENMVFSLLCTFIFINIFSFLVSCIVFGNDFLSCLFLSGGASRFTDFTDNIIQCSGYDAFTKFEIIYPPIVALFFLNISKALSPVFSNFLYDDRINLVKSVTCNVLYFTFLAISLVIIAIAILLILKEKRLPLRIFYLVFLLTAYPMFYTYERGNIMIFALGLVLLFLFFYDSKSKWARHFSLISLALAISIKIYPIVFCLYFLNRKDIKSLFVCGVYTIILVFVPFAFYDGLNGLLQMINTNLGFAGDSTVDLTSRVFSLNYLLSYLNVGSNLFAKVVQIGNILVLVICSLVTQSKAKVYACAGCIIMLLDTCSRIYSSIFLIPSFLMLLKESPTLENMFLLGGFSLIFCFNGAYDFVAQANGYCWSYLIGSGILMVFIAIVDPIRAYRRKTEVKNGAS